MSSVGLLHVLSLLPLLSPRDGTLSPMWRSVGSHPPLTSVPVASRVLSQLLVLLLAASGLGLCVRPSPCPPHFPRGAGCRCPGSSAAAYGALGHPVSFRAVRRGPGPRLTGPPARRVDANADRRISAKEMQRWIVEKTAEHFQEAVGESRAHFRAVDPDGDGMALTPAPTPGGRQTGAKQRAPVGPHGCRPPCPPGRGLGSKARPAGPLGTAARPLPSCGGCNRRLKVTKPPREKCSVAGLLTGTFCPSGRVSWDEYKVKFLASKGHNEREVAEKIKNDQELKVDEESECRVPGPQHLGGRCVASGPGELEEAPRGCGGRWELGGQVLPLKIQSSRWEAPPAGGNSLRECLS